MGAKAIGQTLCVTSAFVFYSIKKVMVATLRMA